MAMAGMSFEQVVDHFENVKPCAGGVTARCPAHQDRQNSLKVSKGDDRSLIHCFAGCSIEAICEAKGLSTSDLFFVSKGSGSNGVNGHANGKATSRITLQEFATAKGFTVDFLRQHGVSEESRGLIFHHLLMNGQRAKRQHIRTALSHSVDHWSFWSPGEGSPVPYGLWRLKEAAAAGVTDLVLVEGESDTLTLWAHQLIALGIPGADMCKIIQAPHLAGFRRVLICRETDAGGENFEKGCTGRLATLEFPGSVGVIEMARAEVKDANDLHLKLLGNESGFLSEWEALVLQARTIDLPLTGVEVFGADQIEEKQIGWLWRNRIPLGKLVLYVGAPGLGKSFASLDLAARLTNGSAWPDGSPNGLIADSIIFSAEDGMADTIVPRLIALGADRGHIWIAKRVREVNESGEVARRGFNLARDLPKLEKLLDQRPTTRLVVIDPVSAYMSRVDTHKNAEVRSEVLDPLAELAERRDITVLAVTHLNKGAGTNALERVSGSIAFPAAARAVWGFSKDPDDTGKGLMLFGKSNVGPEMPGLAYRIAEDENRRATLQWIVGDVNENLSDVMRRDQENQREGGPGKSDRVRTMLVEMLSEGARPASEIESKAREMGISERSLKKARWDLGVLTSREGFGKGSRFVLSLPTNREVVPND